MTITLRHADWAVTLLPSAGGSIGSLRLRDIPILRGCADDETDPLHTACFPLVPYVNRIADCRFDFAGRRWQLAPNFGAHPHCLHGVGWQRPWRVAWTDGRAARLELVHDSDADWPWPFEAEQLFEVADAGFSATIRIRNTANEEVPAGLGFHPYFPRLPDSRLTARLGAAWTADATQLPLARVQPDHFGDWARGDTPARDQLVDNAHEGWDGRAEIRGGGLVVRMTATGTDGLHLFMPPGADFFCAEPVTHLPDALNRGRMPCLAPGAAFAITMRLSVD